MRWININWLWLSMVLWLVDRVSKQYALTHLNYGEPNPITAFLNFTLAFNKGIAFSFFSEGGEWQFWVFGGLSLTISVLILFWLVQLPTVSFASLALAFIFGGALGNLWDRLHYGYVIDFIDCHIGDWHWPIFNCADAAITLGALLLILDVLRKKN